MTCQTKTSPKKFGLQKKFKFKRNKFEIPERYREVRRENQSSVRITRVM